MFGLMLTTSYAWYSFADAKTDFNIATSMDNVEVTFMKGEYINTDIAVPISAADADKYAEKHDFIIRAVNNSKSSNKLAATISLEDITIDSALKVSDMKIELYYQGNLLSSTTGSSLTSSSFTFKKNSKDCVVELDNDNDNIFQLRLYILSSSGDQSGLMNRTLKAKIKANVISRLIVDKTEFNDNETPDIYVANITIDGASSKYLPTSGLYNMSASCSDSSNNSKVEWDSLSKTITYSNGFKIGDVCDLAFTPVTDYPLLNTVAVGSYVSYIGSNGCDGRACEGINANYVSNDDKGYCGGNDMRYLHTGWRVGYIESGIVYLVSAGSPECLCTDVNGNPGNTCAEFDVSLSNNVSVTNHISNLNKSSLKYCNSKFVYGGVCNEETSRNMNAIDFYKMLNVETINCYDKFGCGYNNDLFDNGARYWISDIYSGDGYFTTAHYGSSRYLTGRLRDTDPGNDSRSFMSYGIRPVVKLDYNVFITGGSGSESDPYTIGI